MVKTSILSDISNRLALFSDTPDLDASVLLAHILDKPRTWVLAHPELTLADQHKQQMEAALARLENGEPFPYVLGHWEFFGLDLEVTPEVLIPRPETELLVEKAIAWLQASPVRRTVADVGTGSGAIALAIAANVRAVHVIATDISAPALEVARRNARKHALTEQIDFLECDLLPPHTDPLPTADHFDLICANLPYVPTDTLHGLPIHGREPSLALDGGADGLAIIRKLLNCAPAWLAPNGLILLEIEATRGVQAVDMAYDLFSQAEIHLHRDLTGRDRLLEIRL